jgi:serine/threonine-protein phosphatase 2A activator
MAATTLTFMIPNRQILTKDDLEKFRESDAYNDFTGFVERLNNSVIGLPLSTECFISPVSF